MAMRRVAILMYHQVEVDVPASRMLCPAKIFREQMKWLRRSGRPVVRLAEVISAAKGVGSVPENAVAVTFDDGYEAFVSDALPILLEFKIPATVFVVAGLLGHDNDWVGENRLARRKLIDIEQLRELPKFGVDLGSHSMSHPRLIELPDADLEQELVESRRLLGDICRGRIELLAYPYGAYDERVKSAAERAGYVGACSTRSGFNADGVDVFALRRIDIYGTDSMHVFTRKLELGVSEWGYGNELRYLASRVFARMVQP